MSQPIYEIWLDSPRGNRLVLVDHFEALDAVHVANGVGACSLALPDEYDDYLMVDGLIEIWRKPEGGALKNFGVFMYRKWDFIDDGGIDLTTLSGKDGNSLLQRRVIAFPAGQSGGRGTNYADDLIKNRVRENCTTASITTDADRDWTDLNFSIAPDVSAAPSISMSFSYQGLWDVVTKGANASRTEGTRLYFDTIPTFESDNTIGWQFVTNVGQLGIDRTGTDQVIFGSQFGNFDKGKLTFDYTDEATVIYSLGQGLETERTIEEVEDTTRSVASPWARIERTYNCAGQATSTAEVAAAGNARLSELRPRHVLTGTLLDSQQARFGIDWNYGDRVVVTHRGRQFDVVITSIQLTVDGNGREKISAGFEVV